MDKIEQRDFIRESDKLEDKFILNSIAEKIKNSITFMNIQMNHM